MKIKLKIYIVIALSLIAGCKRTDYKDTLEIKINQFLISEKHEYDYVVIIPNSGCTGCITNAENYFIKNVNNNRIKFIFTQILSNKELELRLKKENIKKPNVYIDNSDTFFLTGYQDNIYPYIATISNNKIIEIQRL